MRRYALLLALLLWLVPAPAGAEKSTPLIFEIDHSLSQPKYVTTPIVKEVSLQSQPRPPIKTRTAQPDKTDSSNRGRNNSKFASGYCTDYVAQKVKVTWSGNANQWLINAKIQGYQVDRLPVRGAILVTNESRYGHVAYIESVTDSAITISEWNYSGRYKKTIRTLNINDQKIKGIIHL